MKKKVFSLMMTLLLAFMGVAKADVVTIGEGTSTTYYCPFNSLYGYSFVEEIYTAAEVGMAGNITSISFDLSQSYTSAQTNNVVLYMKNVSRTSFSSNSDWETVTAGDIVYQGTWTIPANYTGWMTITLDTPFAYDGSSNLMIAMHESTAGYSTRYVHYTSTSNAVFTAHSDSYNPDPYNLGSYSGTKSTNGNRANIQLDITAAGGGAGAPATLLVHDGTTTNGYVPVYGYYADSYLKCEMVYPAAELSAMNGGTINGMTFYASQTSVDWGSANFQVFVSEVADATISSFYGPGTVVYEGALSIVDGEMAVTFTTPYQYNGGNLLVGVYNTVTGSYVTSSWYGETVNGASFQGYSYSSLSAVDGSQRNFLPKTNFDYVTAGGGQGLGDVLFALQYDEENEEWVEVDTINVGPRPNGAWMEPFTFQLRNDGPATTVSLIDFTPQNYFTVAEPEMPLAMAHNAVEPIALNTGDAGEEGELYWQMVAIYGEGRTARVWDIMAEAYNPGVPDVVETAHVLNNGNAVDAGFTYQGVPANIQGIELNHNYNLPFPEIPDGQDAVYKFTVDNDVILNAHVDENAENGKVVLYKQDGEELPHPMVDNNYTGLASGAAAAAPFEAQIGEGTNTTGYFPFYTLYNYTISENLYLAAELEEASVTTAPMTSLSWYATNTTGYNQQGITIWMANVDDEALTTTSHIVTGMTKVYTGAMTPVIGWNEFVFNEESFAWDGHSNVLIYCQRNNGAWNSTISWQATSAMGFNCMAYRYQDSGAYDPTIANTMYTSTVRPNIIMKGGNREGGDRNRDIVEIGDGTSTTNVYPTQATYNYCFNEMIYPADQIGMAGTINSIGFHYNGASALNRSVVVYMKNVTRSSFESTTDWEAVTASDVVYTGTLASEAVDQWITLTLDAPFYYDGTSNLMIALDDNTGTWSSRYWYYTNGPENCSMTYYNDNTNPDPYNPPTASGRHVYLPNLQLDITPGGGGQAYTAGPVIENLPLQEGTYFLVASATQNDYEVFINVDAMPCPIIADANGQDLLNPVPADDADDIEPASVTLRWQIPEYATGWRLIFGSTYHPEPNHPQTVIYPEDGSFSTNMVNSYTVRNLWNNTNYFWRVEFNNDDCEDGVSSPVYGFTTTLNVPQNLTAVDYTVFNDETITLNWNAIVDRTYRQYNIYRDGELIDHTTVNQIGETTYTDGPLAYNMDGYTYYVTAIYDEGESAPSNTVNVKVSGYSNTTGINGYVWEMDGQTGIAGATVTLTGNDEFGVSHTYTATTNNNGYYNKQVYAGEYSIAIAHKDGYQDAQTVHTLPFTVNYNGQVDDVNFILDENFDPVCSVIAEYYPDSLDPNSPYVKVYWGCGLPGEEIVEPFETGDFSAFDWQIDPTYPWSITTNNPYEGTYCMKSGGAGVPNVVSNMTVTVNIPADGEMSFFGKISCENNWDFGYFYIDGVQKASFTGAGNWIEKTYDITAGDHTFQWRYTKDGSVNSNDDCFYVDYITFYKRPAPAIPGMTYTFDDGTMQGWTSVDADGDGNGWMVGSELMSGVNGHNGSADFVFSQSYSNSIGVLYPDNYLVSPLVQLGGVVRFYACAQDASYAAEHFGVAVSTTNTNPSSFTTIQEWTMSAKDVPAPKKVLSDPSAEVAGMGHSRNGNMRAQGNWYEYTVDLSAYSGNGYVAIRHFNCSDMFYLDVDDITIGEPGKGVAETRAFDHYRIYRTNCYNDGPYTEENTVLLATNWPGDTVYIDVEWADLAPGVYKWGVGCVYAGNRGEMVEGEISWAEPVAITRDATAENDPNPVSGEEGIRAPWDLLNSFNATSGYQYGVATDGNYIYTSSWSASSTSQFYKYDMDGNFVEEFNVSGSGQCRDLTYDGQYFYGVANSTTIYCLDLANHSLVSTIASGYGAAQRGITYDPVRDGFWVIGNWSGNLKLVDRTGAVVTTGPAPTSASGLAYYKDENDVEHVYCFNNGDNGVYDYNITTNTMGGSVFNFNSLPGATGTSGGCHVAEYNGKVAFFGDIQQSPQLIGIYELKDAPVGPTPGNGNNLNELALDRESETIWSNCLDKDMYLNGDVTINVLLNSADSPEGTTVDFMNYNEAEQELYPMEQLVLDETGYYEFPEFRRGDYQLTIQHEGYETILDSVHIWEPTDLRYVMIEIIYGVSDLYVSSTGWAMWGAMGAPSNPNNPNGPQGQASTFSVNFDDSQMPAGWTTIDANNDGYNWVLGSQIGGVYLISGASLQGSGHNSSNDMICSGSYSNYTGSAITPDNYLVSPQVTLVNGSTFSFWACAQDGGYPYEHFGVFVSDNGTSDWTEVQSWTMTAKGSGDVMSVGRGGEMRAQGNWYQKTVDLSAYAGQKYIAIRHFSCNDQFILDVDDIELTAGAKNAEAERHLESFKVMCTSIDGEPIYNANVPADQPFCQLATDELVPGDHYICKVAAMYSTGMSDWSECEWQYIPCDNYAGTVNGVTIEGNEISWEYPGGGITPPGQGDEFTVDFEAGLPAGWNVIDANNDSYTWTLTSNIPTAWPYYASLTLDWYHSGSNAICSGSYINGVGAITPDEYLVTEQVNLVNGSTFSFYAAATDAGYPADHFGVFVSDNGTSNWEMVNEWTLTAKGGDKGDARASRDGNGLRLGTWHTYSVDLSAYAGQQKYIAIRHFNCTDQYIMCVDDIELTTGAKANRNPWDLMMTFSAPEGGHYGVAYDGNNFYTSNWGYSSAAYNFYKYDLDGNMLEGFNISGCGTLRGITYDGTYFYGVANSSTVYCVDLAAHSVVSTFTSAYGAMRGITYDPERDGFWVIGNWSGNLTLINRQGAIVTTGPAPESASDLAYYKDENDVEHVFCFNNGTNDVVDWVIGNATMGSSVFNFSSTPGFASGASSGGCTVGSFNGKIAFIGDLQQSPNLIGVYELREDNTTPVPVPTGDILGAMIFADGEWEAFVEYPTNTYTYEGEAEMVCVRLVYNGTNNLPEGNIYYSMSCPECEPYMPGTITCEPGAPVHSELLDENHIKLWWGDEPQAPVEDWIYYDNGTYSDAIGTGGSTVYWACMFPANSLAAYAGTNLTKVAMYEDPSLNTQTITVTVYLGGTTAPQTAVSTQSITPTGSEGFHEVVLNTPVAVDGTQNLWIVYSEYGTYPATGCTDTGDANGRWISVDGNTWEDVAGYGLNYTWMIRGFLTNQAKGSVQNIAIEPAKPVQTETVNSLSAAGLNANRPADLSFMNRASIVKYNVYRSTEANGDYVLIDEVTEETAPNYYEYIDSPTLAGTYYYQVTAVYDNDCESEPALAADGSGHDYVSETTTADGVDENGGMAIFPNPTKANVTIQAMGMQHITVVSVLGQVVYDADVDADEIILNMSQYAAGMYTVRVVTENGIRVERVSVVR